MYAAMENKLVLVRQIIRLGCDVNAVNKEGYSALHLGSMYAREPLVSLLLSKGANPSLTGGVSIREITSNSVFNNFYTTISRKIQCNYFITIIRKL